MNKFILGFMLSLSMSIEELEQPSQEFGRGEPIFNLVIGGQDPGQTPYSFRPYNNMAYKLYAHIIDDLIKNYDV